MRFLTMTWGTGSRCIRLTMLLAVLLVAALPQIAQAQIFGGAFLAGRVARLNYRYERVHGVGYGSGCSGYSAGFSSGFAAANGCSGYSVGYSAGGCSGYSAGYSYAWPSAAASAAIVQPRNVTSADGRPATYARTADVQRADPMDGKAMVYLQLSNGQPAVWLVLDDPKSNITFDGDKITDPEELMRRINTRTSSLAVNLHMRYDRPGWTARAELVSNRPMPQYRSGVSEDTEAEPVYVYPPAAVGGWDCSGGACRPLPYRW